MPAAAAVALLLGAVTAMGARRHASGAPAAGTRVATETPVDTQRAVLAAKGMSCERCERTITIMLKRTPGVVSATVSVQRGEAVVLYDPRHTAPAKLVAVIEQLGYSAAVKKA